MKRKKKQEDGFTASPFPDVFQENETNVSAKTKVSSKKKKSGLTLKTAKIEIERLQQENARLLSENNILMVENRGMKNKAEVYDLLMGTSGNCFTTTVVAKMLGMSSAEKLNEYLASKRVQYKTSDDCWVLYAEYANKKYVMFRWYDYGTQSKYQTPLSRPHMYWTLKGIEFIRSLRKKDGLLKS
uniref:Antirepressor protein C-terminal domain-containing protein n=1 Tax=uncultured Alphaproteobacteria bacterium TaxID=91750 RepID=A0A6G8F375_9PROT|nr:hypothetical protein PlAlph_5340 [uncultured Alphaproteobacteria bacterium]